MPEPLELTWTPSADVPAAYADVAHDHSDVHLDPAVAAGVGLPGVILHGMYLFGAMANRLEQLAAEDGRALAEMECRFAAPARPGRALTARLEPGDDGFSFTVSQADHAIVVGGRATTTDVPTTSDGDHD